MEVLLISLMILLYTLQSFVCKIYADNYPGKSENSSLVYSIFIGVIVAISTLVITGFSFKASGITWLLGLINSVILFGYNFFLIGASQIGAYSIVMASSIAGGILIPTFVSLFFMGGHVGLITWVCIVAIVLATFLICRKPTSEGRFTLRFGLLCLGLCFCNGMYGSLLNIQQDACNTMERNEMIAITFFFSAVIGLLYLIFHEKGKVLQPMKQTKKSMIVLLLCGLISTAAIHTLTYVLPLVNVTVLYSFDNAGVLVLSMVCSALFFKEKYRLSNVFGGALMCVSLFCISWFQ